MGTRIEKELKVDHLSILLYDGNNEQIGSMYLCRSANDEYEILRLFVKQQYRNQGFGTQMLETAAEELSKYGASIVAFKLTEPQESLLIKQGFTLEFVDNVPYYTNRISL